MSKWTLLRDRSEFGQFVSFLVETRQINSSILVGQLPASFPCAISVCCWADIVIGYSVVYEADATMLLAAIEFEGK